VGAKLEPARSFGRASPVREYWLAHCQGFRLRTGRRRTGVVEAVGYDGSLFQPEVLAVRVGLRRKVRLIPAEAVEEVVPAERLLVVGDGAAESAEVGRGPTRTGHALRGASRALARGTLAAGRLLAAGLRTLLLLTASGALALARGARRAGHAGGATTARAFRLLSRASIVAARGLRRADAAVAAGIRTAAARLAVVLRRAGTYGRNGAVRLGHAAAPRARAAGAWGVQTFRAVNGRLEGQLLRLHTRLAPDPSHEAAPSRATRSEPNPPETLEGV
jgi:hypothetical protein